jgi:hypothetical protein
MNYQTEPIKKIETERTIPYPRTEAEIYMSISLEGLESLDVQSISYNEKRKEIEVETFIIGDNRTIVTLIAYPLSTALELLQTSGHIESYATIDEEYVSIPTEGRTQQDGSPAVHEYDNLNTYYHSDLFTYEDSLNGLEDHLNFEHGRVKQ